MRYLGFSRRLCTRKYVCTCVRLYECVLARARECTSMMRWTSSPIMLPKT